MAYDARIVNAFESPQVEEQTLQSLRAALDRAGIAHVVLPRPVEGRAFVALDGDDELAVASALKALSSDREWGVALGSGWRAWHRPLASWVRRVGTLPPRFTLFRVLASPSGLVVGNAEHGVTVELWPTVPVGTARVDGGGHVQDTRVAPGPNSSFPYLTPQAWSVATAQGGGAVLRSPHLLDVQFPVDVVYTWVDGSDPRWLRRKEAALRSIDEGAHNATAMAASRFTARDELRYSLRSLEMYAGWVRQVHIVTDGQVPEWLDQSDPRVNVVHHREIFRDPSVLPVFNSHAIESQLHHIDGLADHYLYLNDDVFFGRPVTPEQFFEANGLTRFFLSTMLLDVGPPSACDLPVLSAAKNNRELLERTFGRTVTNKFQHTPHPQRRDVLAEMEARFPEEFARVAASVFRHPDDISVASSLYHYYAHATGRAVIGSLRYHYRDISTLRTLRDLTLIDDEGHDVFCLNDTQLQPGPRADRAVGLLSKYLARRFPLPSGFEKK
ncbi:stealth family protein [Isoptericola sp. NEAU-Y5]|uniref:Stealth family protein n=1 Tax=Isoptericola luteus TaxID=2879484 RepID=A0ABS7ZCE5_9MICO|nr:stealth family protein [Isoptericola sp. NEAU-Y5]MCA5892724.1 stealth family protein [Isoptericola sp. NEAU-Y5]